MGIIQEELNQIAKEWNTQYIRKQKNVTSSPPGIPDKLFYMPELIGKCVSLICLNHMVFFLFHYSST